MANKIKKPKHRRLALRGVARRSALRGVLGCWGVGVSEGFGQLCYFKFVGIISNG